MPATSAAVKETDRSAPVVVMMVIEEVLAPVEARVTPVIVVVKTAVANVRERGMIE
jgi:hypothetical protein